MNTSRNNWKIFGIIVIVLALVIFAFVIGRGFEKRKQDQETETAPSLTQPAIPVTQTDTVSTTDQNVIIVPEGEPEGVLAPPQEEPELEPEVGPLPAPGAGEEDLPEAEPVQ